MIDSVLLAIPSSHHTGPLKDPPALQRNLECRNDHMKLADCLAEGSHFSFSAPLPRVVEIRTLLVLKTLSAACAGEDKFCKAELERCAELMVYAIRCNI